MRPLLLYTPHCTAYPRHLLRFFGHRPLQDKTGRGGQGRREGIMGGVASSRAREAPTAALLACRRTEYLLSTFHPNYHAYKYEGSAPGGASDQLRRDVEAAVKRFTYSKLKVEGARPGCATSFVLAKLKFVCMQGLHEASHRFCCIACMPP